MVGPPKIILTGVMPRSTESLKLVNAGLAKQSPVTTRFSRACSGARWHVSQHWVGWDSSCSCVPERVQSHDWEWHHRHRCRILSPFYVVCPCLKERDQAVRLRTTVRCCWESSSGCVQGRQYKDLEAPVPETPGLDTQSLARGFVRRGGGPLWISDS